MTSDITAVDISPIAVHQCKQKAELMGIENIDFLVADCRRLHTNFPPHSFDRIIDKGLVDALYCGGDPENSMQHVFREANRVLRPGGKMLSVQIEPLFGFLNDLRYAYISEESRKEQWNVECRRLLPLSSTAYFYIFTKQTDK